MGFDVHSVIGNVSIAITESVTVLPINGNHPETDSIFRITQKLTFFVGIDIFVEIKNVIDLLLYAHMYTKKDGTIGGHLGNCHCKLTI